LLSVFLSESGTRVSWGLLQASGSSKIILIF
jgi:hypothetical protein